MCCFFLLFFSVHLQWTPQAKGGVTLKYNDTAKYFGKFFSALSRAAEYTIGVCLETVKTLNASNAFVSPQTFL